MTIQELFEAHEDDFLCWDHVPKERRRHERPDIHVFIALAEIIPVDGHPDMVQSAGHDQIWLDGDADAIDVDKHKDLLIDCIRAGLMYDSETGGLSMFV